jgi:carboxyl-terminal processing protease
MRIRSGKTLRFFQKLGFKKFGLGLGAVLLVLGCLTALLAAESTSDYEALRLYSEALDEISQKAVTQVNGRELFEGSLRGIMNSLDPDSSYLNAQEFIRYQKGDQKPEAEAGMELVFKDNLLTAVSVLDDGPGDRAGLKAGDHILKIDGQLIRNITTQEGVRYFRGPAGKTLKLQVLRSGLVKPLDLSVTLEPLGSAPIKVQKLEGDYVYVRLPYFTDKLPRDLSQELIKLNKLSPPAKGIILDLRNNARGNLEHAVRTASLFLGDLKVASTRGRRPGSEQFYHGSEREQVLKTPVPLVILVNQSTARAAEILAGALQHYNRALLLGEKTFGLCGLTQVLPLQDGSALLMTVADCYTPGGRKISGEGLKPDIEGKKISEDTESLTSPSPPPEKDPWVQQAVEVLKKGDYPRLVSKAPTS